jgi:hypothetical protein
MSHTPTAVDPRVAIRADLVAAGQRRMATRRRRRGATFAAVAVSGLLGTAAATAAIGGYSTGVPVLDEVLAISAQRTIEMRGATPDRGAAPVPDVLPGPGGASAPVELPGIGADGQGTGIGAAYANRSGMVCFVLVGADRRPDRGGTGCTAPKIVTDWLDAAPAAVAGGGSVDGQIASHGYARPDVTALSFAGPSGPVEAFLGDAWTPRLADATRLRPFVVVLDQDVTALGAEELLRVLRGDLTATLADGRVVEIPR